MSEPQSILEIGLSDDEKDLLSPTFKAWAESAKTRDASRLDFQNKMAVLCAGSIAVLVSGVVTVASSSALQHRLPAHFAAYVIFAASALWLSLVCCTMHNYFEIARLERDSKSKMEDSLLAIADVLWTRRGLSKEDRRQKIAALPMSKDKEKRAQRALRVAEIQPFLTLAGVVLFCLGYLAVIVFIVIAALSA